MKMGFALIGLWLSIAAHADDSLLGMLTEQQILSVQSFKVSWQGHELPVADEEDLVALHGLHLVVLFGFWCHDSEREVPRLIKTLAQARLASVQYIAVDRNKKAPGDLHQRYDLKYTPTVILLDGTQEIGRIIEQPEGDWLSHLAKLRHSQPEYQELL